MAYQQPLRPLGASAQKAPLNSSGYSANAVHGTSTGRGTAPAAVPVDLVTVKPQCDVCGKTGGDLFASECSHLTLCTACGKTMASDEVPCPQCGSAVRKLIKEYAVRLGSKDRQYTIAKFPQGLPGFRTGQGAQKEWTLHREKRTARELLKGQQDKGWRIEDDTGQACYKGMPEAVSKHASHFLFIRPPKRHDFEAVPVSWWFSFQKLMNVKSLESAEEMDKARETREKKLAVSTGRFIKKREEPEDGAGKGRKGGGARGGSGSGRGRRGDDDDEDDFGGGRLGRMGDEETIQFDGMGGGQEDWEHEEDRQDDDEAVQADAEDAQQQQKMEAQALEEEVEEEGVNMEELHQVWKEAQELNEGRQNEEDGNKEAELGIGLEGQIEGAQGQEEEEEDEGMEDEDEDEDEDDLAFSPVFMNKVVGAPAAPPSTPPGAAAAAGPGAGAAAGAGAGARGTVAGESGAKRKAEAPAGGASPLQASKKPSLEAGRKTPPPAKARPSAAPPGAAPAAPAKPTELTEGAVSSVLRVGAMTSKDLVTRFRHLLKTDEDKKRFQEILKSVGKMQTQKGQKVIVLKS